MKTKTKTEDQNRLQLSVLLEIPFVSNMRKRKQYTGYLRYFKFVLCDS